MLDITILTVGKIKEEYFKKACEEYTKRLSLYARISVEEIPYEPFRHEGEKNKVKQKEGERIKRFLEKRGECEVFILDERGKEYTSEQFAGALETTLKPTIFVIGGSLGMSEEVLSLPHKKIALSSFTFPHELARVVLLEQIYRAVTIMNGKTYHY
ncbi:MAG: 23S rRNA (pseudouridine(1915)-N(3))-methyltransferase RlmH [Patescibacteria group bacterium]